VPGVLNARGQPLEEEGLTEAPGIYFAGVDFSSTRKSGTIMRSTRRRNASSATLSPDADRAAVVHQIVLNRLRWRLRHIKNCDVACWQILLQKSKIERCRNSRESRFLDSSTVARLGSADAQVRGQFCAKQ